MYQPPENDKEPTRFDDLFPPARPRKPRRPRATAEEIENIRRDYIAGMNLSDMRKKYKYNGNSMSAHYSDLIVPPPVPPQEPGETSIAYANRCMRFKCATDREFNIRRGRAISEGLRARKPSVSKPSAPKAAAPLAPPPAVAVEPTPIVRPTVWQLLTSWLRV